MADPYSGFRALGEALGGKIGTPGVYEDTLKKTYSTEEQLQQARRARSLAMIDDERLKNRQAITGEALGTLGFSPEAQGVLANILGSNSTIDMKKLGEFQRPGYDVAAKIAQSALLGTPAVPVPVDADETAMYAHSLGTSPTLPSAPDAATYNRARAYMEGKDYQPIRVVGGNMMADGATLGDADLIPLPQTLAGIQAVEARTQQGQERTAAAIAKSNRPPAPRSSSSAGKPPTAAAAEASVLAEARAAISAGAPIGAVKARLKERGYSKLAGRL